MGGQYRTKVQIAELERGGRGEEGIRGTPGETRGMERCGVESTERTDAAVKCMCY